MKTSKIVTVLMGMSGLVVGNFGCGGSSAKKTDARPIAADGGRMDGLTPVDGPAVVDMAAGPTDVVVVAACQISKPTRTVLNGIPVAMGGDRVSAVGSPFQVAFEVITRAEDRQPVVLEITPRGGMATQVTSMAMAGLAAFTGVTLAPDGAFDVEAICTPKAGPVTRSPKVSLTVDSKDPALTVTSPDDGATFGPDMVPGGKLKICASTVDADAVDLPATAAAMGQNLCAAIGMATPICAKVMKDMVGMGGNGCVEIACPGGAPFDLNVSLADQAGNRTTRVVKMISCASKLPSVQIVAPAGDMAPFADKAKHLLAAGAAQAFKDLDPAKEGAQTNVVACVDQPGIKARLLVGSGGSLSVVGAEVSAVAAVAADGCPMGLGFVAKWNAATLPESLMDQEGQLVAPTQIRVDVGEGVGLGSSPVSALWIDSAAPSVRPWNPNPLCGVEQASLPGDWVTDLALASTTRTLVVDVVNDAKTVSYAVVGYASGIANVGDMTTKKVSFKPGVNQVNVKATDPAGNPAILGLMAGCQVIVGPQPVTWITPPGGSALCAAGATAPGCVADADAAMPGWQGPLRVRVTAMGVPVVAGAVTFEVGGVAVGTDNLNASGEAGLATITVPEGAAVKVKVSSASAMSERTLAVDVTAPGALGAFKAEIKDRRRTTIHLGWTGADDGGKAAAGYDIRLSKAPITAANFDSATPVSYTGMPSAPGAVDGIDITDLTIETAYHFAVAARDAAGNRSVLGIAGPVQAKFNLTIVSAPAGSPMDENFAVTTDGSADLNGDKLSDLLVGTTKGRALLYLGKVDLATPLVPATIFSSLVPSFGSNVAMIGDIDGDGREDLAVSGPFKVYIFKGRATWPATLSAETQADYVVTADSKLFMGAAFGASIARVGDFNADGANDFAIGAPGWTQNQGRVVVVFGKNNGFSSVNVPDPIRTVMIDGEEGATKATRFGTRVLGLGRFYGGTAGSTLVVGAPAVDGSIVNEGRVYSFRGSAGVANNLALTTATSTLIGPARTAQWGFRLANIGPLSSTLPAVAIGNATDKVTAPMSDGTVVITAGTEETGPLGGKRWTLTAGAPNNIGLLVFGGGFSGLNFTSSIFGDSRPDVGMYLGPPPGMAATGGKIVIVSGAALAGTSGTVDAEAAAEIVVSLPAGWGRVYGQTTGLVRDANGDGAVDFVVDDSRDVQKPGRFALYW